MNRPTDDSIPYDLPLPQDFFRRLPRAPGVYLMYGRHDRLLYVGKAKDLRTRLSFYRRVNSKNASPKVLRLVRLIRRIEIETCETEHLALLREGALIRERKPAMNVLNTRWRSYFFIALRHDPRGLTLQLTTDPTLAARGFTLHGAYRGRNGVREAYIALQRLLWLCLLCPKGKDFPSRFEIPSPLMKREGTQPLEIPLQAATGPLEHWMKLLETYLAGESLTLLQTMVETLLFEERIPPHCYTVLQDDLNRLQNFYARWPTRIRALRIRHGIKESFVGQDRLDDFLTPPFACSSRKGGKG